LHIELIRNLFLEKTVNKYASLCSQKDKIFDAFNVKDAVLK